MAISLDESAHRFQEVFDGQMSTPSGLSFDDPITMNSDYPTDDLYSEDSEGHYDPRFDDPYNMDSEGQMLCCVVVIVSICVVFILLLQSLWTLYFSCNLLLQLFTPKSGSDISIGRAL
jgi:hypothetical protein